MARAYGARPEHKVNPIGTACSRNEGIESGPAYFRYFKQIAKAVVLAPTVSTAGFPDSTVRESRNQGAP